MYADGNDWRKQLVGHNIVRARDLVGFTQAELARQLTIDARQLSEWERGKHEPRPRQLQRIAQKVNQPVSFFYAEHDEVAAC